MLRRATRSTLFPYTTLFRSSVDEGTLDRLLDPVAGVGTEARVHARIEAFDGTQEAEVALFNQILQTEALADRKSTRLNSSHANISYAVFCLKKKNTPLRHVR